MEFCSKYGYNYGFEGSDNEEYSDEDEQTKKKIKKKIRKADTNIIAVKFDKLVAANEMFAGEPKSCKKCGAIMSFLSEANVVKSDGKIVWTCEFCSEVNDMTSVIDDLNEIPKKDDITFMLEVAKPKESSAAATASSDGKQVSADDSYLSLCVDVSGSMDTVIPGDNTMSRLTGVKGACMETLKKLKEEEPCKRVSLVTFSDLVKYYGDCTQLRNESPILTIGGGGGSHYNSYQQQAFCQIQQPIQQQQIQVQIAPQQQQQSTTSSKPFQRIRNFFNRNNHTGSGGSGASGSDDESNNNAAANANPAMVSSHADLDNKERIITFANNLSGDLKGISLSHNAISDKLKFLHTEGSTALGPALLFSIAFAAKKPGSSIILCTDGCANAGMGSIETNPGRENEKFYDDMAEYAKERGVVVNVISMEGTDCKLALLGRVADKSNGSMSIVNPLNLGDEFKSILSNRIVATNVTAKLIVNHKYLYIRDEKLETEEGKAIDAQDEKAKAELEGKKQSGIERSIGNANIDTEITFEYGIRKIKDQNEKKEGLKESPFQLQVTYTAQDGSKAIRVYTKKLEFTTKREDAEQNVVEQDILWAHNAQMMSNQVLQSNVAASKFRGEAVNKLAMRNNMLQPQMYSDFSSNVQKYSKSKKAVEMADCEAEEAFYANKMSRAKMNKKK